MTESTTLPPQTLNRPVKRCAIVGTAPTWVQTPWQDEGLDIFCLNDAYLMGQPRASIWFDLHPPSHMAFRPKGQRVVNAVDVQVGTYLRPEGHLDWLRTRQFPVFTQEAIGGTTRPFPIAEVLAWWARFWPWRIDAQGRVSAGKEYEASTPALILMWAVMRGYTEIHIYGIHLSTEWEYVQQRPNLEFLMGIAAGLGVKIVLPEKAPICKGTFRYAYEPKSDLPEQAIQRQIDFLKWEGAAVQKRLAGLKWYQRAEKADHLARLAALNVRLMDARQQIAKLRARKVA